MGRLFLLLAGKSLFFLLDHIDVIDRIPQCVLVWKENEYFVLSFILLLPCNSYSSPICCFRI